MKSKGFTTVELVAVMVIVGVVAAVAFPKFPNPQSFSDAGFAENVRAILRFAQAKAVAHRRVVCATVTYNASIALTEDPALPGGVVSCSLAVPLPGANCASNVICAPASTTLSTPVASADSLTDTIRFFPSGQASKDMQVNAGEKTIAVNMNTGYVN